MRGGETHFKLVFLQALLHSAYTVEENKARNIEINLNFDSWFKIPHIYDHNYWGGAIMQNQAAMQMVKENRVDVFRVGVIQ